MTVTDRSKLVSCNFLKIPPHNNVDSPKKGILFLLALCIGLSTEPNKKRSCCCRLSFFHRHSNTSKNDSEEQQVYLLPHNIP